MKKGLVFALEPAKLEFAGIPTYVQNAVTAFFLQEHQKHCKHFKRHSECNNANSGVVTEKCVPTNK